MQLSINSRTSQIINDRLNKRKINKQLTMLSMAAIYGFYYIIVIIQYQHRFKTRRRIHNPVQLSVGKGNEKPAR